MHRTSSVESYDDVKCAQNIISRIRVILCIKISPDLEDIVGGGVQSPSCVFSITARSNILVHIDRVVLAGVFMST